MLYRHVLLLQVTGTTHNVVGLVNNTSPDAVDSVATCDQHNNRGDASVWLVGTTNPQQIEVMEFALIVAENGDYSRQCGRGLILYKIWPVASNT